MAQIADIRAGLAKNLSSIAGLRVAATLPESPNPPIALVSLDSSPITYDRAMQRGMDEYRFTITVIVGRADERTAQNTLDLYCSGSGAKSIKQAVELERTLNGKVDDLRVIDCRSYGSLTINETLYMAAEFSVVVYAS